METVNERIARLAITDIPESGGRFETLSIAHEIVDDATFKRIGDASRCARKPTVVIPRHRFEGLSRGRGWARKGRGNNVEWGEREENGYRVGPGKWTVGGNDGFSRKGENIWTVEHVQVGDQIWTIAS